MDNVLSQAQVATRTAQLEKMEAAAMMSRGLAHDLNNLATPVSSFLLHMESRVTAGSPEAEVLDHAKHSIKVMQDYIRESLFFARKHVLLYEPVDSGEILSTVAKLTKERAALHGVTVVSLDNEPRLFTADRTLILRLLQNLVFNGIDATPRGGQVTLSASRADGGRIAFSVADQGHGVPPELMDRIFEPYFTTKDTGSDIRGLGLGLAISLKISGLHGGDLAVGKAPSGGAVFTFTLPVNPAKLVSQPEKSIHHDYSHGHNNQPEAQLDDEYPRQRFDESFNSYR
jgi:signal transduction histidine kinase